MSKDSKQVKAEKRHASHYLFLPWFRKLKPADRPQYDKAFENARTGKLGFWLQLHSFINYLRFRN